MLLLFLMKLPAAELPVIKRIYGTEVEYGMLSHIDPDSAGNFHYLPAGLVEINGFLSNGGRYYSDCSHPEYATPECRTLEEAVTHELAGEQVLLHRAQALRLAGDSEVRLHKRNVDKRGNNPRYWGCHENYLTERKRIDFDGHKFKCAWMAHLATRSVFTGAGTLHDGRYRIAQKFGGKFVQQNTVAHDPNARPLIDCRDEPLANTIFWRRIQVSCGDANISPWALRMKLGTTSLVLRMIEHGVDLSDLAFRKPVQAARAVAFDQTLRQKLKLVDGRAITAIELQRELADRAQLLGKLVMLPDEEYEVINEWRRVTEDLSQDPNLTIGRVDWTTRLSILGREKNRKKISWRHPDLEMHDLIYDQLGPLPGSGQRLRDRGLLEGMPAPAAIERAITNAPRTRAQLRGRMILDASLARPDIDFHAGWDRIDLTYSTGRNIKLILNNPYMHQNKKMLDKIKPVS
jgi:hypothetical protein